MGEAVNRYGQIDVLVNNAGASTLIPHDDLGSVTDEVWETMLGANLIGPWYATRAAVPHLRHVNGCVINITSVAGLRDTFHSAIPYAVAKAALNHLTLLLANALGPDVRVNAVAPGLIMSRMASNAEIFDSLEARVRKTTPLGRVGEPSDIGDTCVLLAQSTYVTGQVVACDGGLHIRVGRLD